RQMRRVVLRDEAPAGVPWDVALLPEPTLDARSVFDRAVHSSMRAASAFFGKTDFDGQINWMTTGLLDVTGERPWSMMTGNVAYLAIGAPIAGHGSWMVRGAWSAGEPSSWVMLGEFTSSGDERHAIRAGVSYGALRPRGTDRVSQGLSVGEARTAGAVYLLDRWTVRPGLDVSYGLRVDAYDYLARSPVLSPRLGARVAVIGRTAVTLDGLQHAVAPGTAEFQPPAAAGLWLPPDRSFASIRSGGAIRAERVRELAVGVEHAFGAAGAERTVAFRRFRQTSHDQLVTLFGPGTAGASHYLTGALGDVEVTGWSARLTGALSPHVRGDITYAAGRVGWESATRMSRRIQALAPSMVRGPRETLHDLSASVHAEIPATSTHVAMAYRVSSGFSATGAAGPVARARFAVEVRQPLPYQPLRGGSFDVLVGVRNLYRDLDDPGSFYDELLTVSPPLRFVGGIQVRF
ncbi:MAG TPA: TonB-dependent receptor, partial [Vicinamibacterales bacterium]|nr:TonB-dependent receptor [Vicinamibacterales bacterium]